MLDIKRRNINTPGFNVFWAPFPLLFATHLCHLSHAPNQFPPLWQLVGLVGCCCAIVDKPNTLQSPPTISNWNPRNSKCFQVSPKNSKDFQKFPRKEQNLMKRQGLNLGPSDLESYDMEQFSIKPNRYI